MSPRHQRALRPQRARGTAVLSVSPSATVPITVPEGTTQMQFQFLQLVNIGTAWFAAPAVGAVTYQSGSNWILTHTTNGSLVAITVDPSSLPVGTHTATFPLTDRNAANSPLTITVEVTVQSTAAAPAISISGGSGNFVFSAAEGTGTLAGHTRDVSNEYGDLSALGTVTVTNPSASWINASYAAGVLTVEPIITGVPPGTHTGTFYLTATGAANSPRLMPPVTLTITPTPAPAVLSLSPANLPQSGVAGGSNPSNQTATISNSGAGGTPALGTLSIGNPVFQQGNGWCSASLIGTSVIVSYNIAGLTTGTYNATVAVNASAASNTPVLLPISLTITGGGGSGAAIAPSVTPPNGMSWNVGLRQWSGVPTDPISSRACPLVMPAFNGAVHTITTMADWTTPTTGVRAKLVAGTIVDGDVISIAADLVGSLTFPARPNVTTGYVQVRSSGHASLPAYVSDYNAAGTANRIDPAVHGAHLRKITANTTNSPSISFDAGARGYWFTGLELSPQAGVLNFDAALLIAKPGDLSTVSNANMIRDIMFERGYIHPNNQNLQRGIWLNSERVTIAHSVLRGITIGNQGNEHQGIHGAQFRYLLAFNNEIDAATENIGPLGVDGGLQANYLAGDAAFIRNYIPKDPTYLSAFRKNWFEIKGGNRYLIHGNYFFNYDIGAQHRAIVLTPDTQTYGEIRDVCFMCNIFDDINGGSANFNSQGSGSFNNLGSSRIEFMHNDYRNVANTGTFSVFRLAGASTPNHTHYNSVHIHHNAFAHWNSAVQDFAGLTQMQDFWFRNNVFKNPCSFGLVFGQNTTNDAALNAHCGAGNWDVRRNVAMTGGASWGATLLAAPHANAVTSATDLFVSPSSGNYTVKNGTQAWTTYGTDGTAPGPDWTLLNAATANVRP